MLTSCNINDDQWNCVDSSVITSLHTVYALGSRFNNDQCTVNALPFFCNVTRFLCNEEFFDLTSMCFNVRDDKCALEWRTVEAFLNISVPDCTSFSAIKNLIFSKAPLPNCSDHFDIFCDSICLPVCGEYNQLGRQQMAIAFISTTICLIGGAVTLIIIVCYKRHEL